MKNSLILFLCLSFSLDAQENIIELEANQSMSISGKGPGQDAAINPYLDEESIAIVKNLGEHNLELRLQKEGEIKKIIPLEPGLSLEIELAPGLELYFDTYYKGKAAIRFKKAEKSKNKSKVKHPKVKP